MRKVVGRYEDSLSNQQEIKGHLYMSKLKWSEADGYMSGVEEKQAFYVANLVKKNLEKSRQPEGKRLKVLENIGVSSCQGIVKANQFPITLCARA